MLDRLYLQSRRPDDRWGRLMALLTLCRMKYPRALDLAAEMLSESEEPNWVGNIFEALRFLPDPRGAVLAERYRDHADAGIRDAAAKVLRKHARLTAAAEERAARVKKRRPKRKR